MRRFAAIVMAFLVFFAIAVPANAQSPGNHSVMLTAGLVPWIGGAGAEYQYRYKDWGFGADLMFGRNAGSVRGFSTHAFAKYYFSLIEGLSAFLSLGAGIVHTWDAISITIPRTYFNPYLTAGFEGRYKWFVSSLEVGYGPGFSDYVVHSVLVKFGVGVSF